MKNRRSVRAMVAVWMTSIVLIGTIARRSSGQDQIVTGSDVDHAPNFHPDLQAPPPEPQPVSIDPALIYDSNAEAGPHHRRKTVQLSDGRESSYTELATGLNVWDRQNQKWAEGGVQMEVFEGGAISRQTAWTGIWSPSSADPNGVFDILFPDGPDVTERSRFRGRCLGLAITQKSTGRSVWIAESVEVAGLVSRDTVLYEDCLVGARGLTASVRYKISLGSVSQDVVLQTVLPTLSEAFSEDMSAADPNDFALEVFTLILDGAAVHTEEELISTTGDDGVGRQLVDTRIDLGGMSLGRGSAFPLGNEGPNPVATLTNSVPVTKRIVQLNGQQYLIESADYSRIAAEAAKLKPLAAVRGRNGKAIAGRQKPSSTILASLLSGRRSLPISFRGFSEQTCTEGTTIAMRGKIKPERQLAMSGYVVDWDLNAGSVTNFLFQSDTTYYVKGFVSLIGATTMEPAVIKFAPGCSLNVDGGGTLLMKTDQWRPAFFVARDDNTIGTPLPDGTNALSGTYAYPAICYYPTSAVTIANIHVRDATYGVYFASGGTGHVVANSQFTGCYYPFYNNNGGNVSLRNLLFYLSDTVIASAGGTVSAQHITVDGANTLFSSGATAAFSFTNCLFVDVSDMGSTNTWPYSTLAASFNGTNADPSQVFQTVGWGQHYLRSDSEFHSGGTTNINAQLLKDLGARTVGPPVIISQYVHDSSWWATNDLTLLPQASRDSGRPPSLGYHYDPIDYIFYQYGLSTPLTNANIAILPGTVIGTGAFFTLGSGTKLRANGTATAPIGFYNAAMIQETGGAGGTQLDLSNGSTPAPDLFFNFTHWGQPSSDFQIYLWGTNSMSFVIANSEFNNGVVNFGDSFRTTGLKLTNTLFQRATIYLDTPQVVTIQNCTFYKGAITLPSAGGSNLKITNSVFDGNTFANGTTSIAHNYNGYTTGSRLPTGGGGGANDVVMGSAMTYATGTFGRYYQALTNFVGRGNTSAANVGLYYFTARSPEIKEGNSTVTIGYHYAAADPSSVGLVGYWRMDEGNGGYTADSSGNGHHGTLVSNPSWTSGQVGPGALVFDGTDDYVSVPDDSSLRLTGDITVALWLRKDQVPNNWKRIFGKGGEYPRNYEIWAQPGPPNGVYGISFWQWDFHSGQGIELDSAAVPTNSWYHIAAVVSGTNGVLYVNGVAVTSSTRSAVPSTTSDPITIANHPILADYFPGAVDDIRLYNRALSANEIAVLAAKSTWDADGDDVPDYLEDANGNGTLESGETNPNSATDVGFSLLITEPDPRFNLP